MLINSYRDIKISNAPYRLEHLSIPQKDEGGQQQAGGPPLQK
jgi:hypothetical protein